MRIRLMPQADDEIKPGGGQGLYTPAWRATTRAMTLDQRGFALQTILVMHTEDWNVVPDDRTLAEALGMHIRTVRRLLPALEAVPAHTLHEQLRHIKRWPQYLIEEMGCRP